MNAFFNCETWRFLWLCVCKRHGSVSENRFRCSSRRDCCGWVVGIGHPRYLKHPNQQKDNACEAFDRFLSVSVARLIIRKEACTLFRIVPTTIIQFGRGWICVSSSRLYILQTSAIIECGRNERRTLYCGQPRSQAGPPCPPLGAVTACQHPTSVLVTDALLLWALWPAHG
jgi:hypothetical protein